MSEVAIRGPGVCAGMGTANSMHIATEALGMALPGTTPVLANSPAMWDAVARAGKRIVEMVAEGLTPRQILTPAAFANAARAMLCISGSINTVKHLQAIAHEAQLDVDVYRLFQEEAERVPLLAAVRPNGPHVIEEFEAAGGALALLRQLSPLLDLSARSVDGRELGAILADVVVADPEVIRPFDRPFSNRPSIVLMRGSLARGFGIVKLGVGDERALQFTGRAIIYHSREDAIAGVQSGEVKPGHVVVLRGLGAKGAPGMGMASALVFALDGAGLSEQVAVVTDGQLSGLVNKGLVVGEVSPEAAEGGALALVEPGDEIAIDVARRVVDLLVPDDVLAARAAVLVAAPVSGERGWLDIYRRTVGPLPGGAVMAG